MTQIHFNFGVLVVVFFLLFRERIMTTALDRITADVAAQKTVIAGATTLINSIPDLIRTAVQDYTNGNEAALTDLADQIEQNSHALQSAVTAGTTHPDPAPVEQTGTDGAVDPAPVATETATTDTAQTGTEADTTTDGTAQG